MLIYFLYQYCRRLEENDYQGKPADMAYMLMILFSTTSKYCFHFIEIIFEKFSVAVGCLMNLAVLFKIPIIAVIYVWCNLNKGEDFNCIKFYKIKIKT